MAVTHSVNGPAPQNIAKKTLDLVGSTIKMALMKSTYSPAVADENWSDTHECDDLDYTAGGVTLPITATEITHAAGVTTVATSISAGEVIFTASGDITARYAVIYDSTLNKLISWINFGAADESSVGGEFKVTLTDGKIFTMDVT